jgi:NAD(P)-dependent dehydrogenase (short-subunit alcohol dehydrogenase family)
MTTTSSLAGKRVLVTGGSRGIGAAIVRRLASQGAIVAVNYRSDKAGADTLVGELRDNGCRIGFPAEPTGDITALTSRPARSFTDWAQAHRTELLTPEAVQNAATIEESR